MFIIQRIVNIFPASAVLYQAILTIAPVVSAQLIDDGSSLSEIARVIICNGVILYALTKIDGRKI